MARIAGVDIPRNKKIEVSITYIFGIGTSNGMVILQKANVNPSTRVRDLTEEEVGRIREVVDREYRVEGDLRPRRPRRADVQGSREQRRPR